MGNSSEIYKIAFLNKGKVYEVFVKQVYQSDLYGFIEIEKVSASRSPGGNFVKGSVVEFQLVFVAVEFLSPDDLIEIPSFVAFSAALVSHL